MFPGENVVWVAYEKTEPNWVGIVVANDATLALLGPEVLRTPLFSRPEPSDIAYLQPDLRKRNSNDLFRLHVAIIFRRLADLQLDGGTYTERLGNIWLPDGLCNYCEAIITIKPRRKPVVESEHKLQPEPVSDCLNNGHK